MSVSYPNQYRNYCTFDIKDSKSMAQIKSSLENPKSEDEVLENLYMLNATYKPLKMWQIKTLKLENRTL